MPDADNDKSWRAAHEALCDLRWTQVVTAIEELKQSVRSLYRHAWAIVLTIILALATVVGTLVHVLVDRI